VSHVSTCTGITGRRIWHKALFYRVNVDELPDVASAFGVSGVPYVVFVKNKEVFAVLTGLHQRSEYKQIITPET